MSTDYPEPLTLDFNVQREDLFALSWEYTRSSPSFQRIGVRSRYRLPIIYVLLWAFIYWRYGFNWVPAAIFLGTALLWFLLSPMWVSRGTKRYIRKAMDEAQAGKALGQWSLSLSTSGIDSKGPLGQSNCYWSTLMQVRLTPSHLFIILGGGTGWPVPIAQVGEQAAKEAYDFIRSQATELKP